ncbi:Foldase protein PrsA precursor [Roseimaritima multifibrata]|uniref:peptidylprolyl isomerase n=1 Tax=Roseimaritima multifibrata TaxID=1930274 RepID=A0A517ML52_9BACT|nr:peptidylprolyl isomerase [Roseimaritima multifibrata]QDS95613.1 Foldase protein PrsA precursor [Roseimaritima multifibrata]
MNVWTLRATLLLTLTTGIAGWNVQPNSYALAQAPTNNVVAVVNADPITRDQLAKEVVLRHGEEVLDEMVNRYLIVQACKAKGIQITGQDVQDEVIRIAKKFGLTTESYLQLLQEERDFSPQQYSKDVVWPMLSLRALVADEVKVTQEERDKAFLSQFGPSVKCRMIMVADRVKAEQLRSMAEKAPEQFGELAMRHSEDETSASVHGLIPPIRQYTGDADFEAIAFNLKENEISKVYPLGDQWVVLQCVRHLPETPPAPHARPMIMQQISDRIVDEKVRVSASKLFAKLQADANVVKVLGDEAKTKEYPGVAAIVNGQKMTVAQVAAECIERHGTAVLDGEVNRKLLTQALGKSNIKVESADLKAEVERAAVSFGYVDADGKADVDSWMQAMLADADQSAQELYIRDAVWPSVALKKLVDGQFSVTQEDLRKGFEANYGVRCEVLAVVLGDQRTAQKVWDMARANPTDSFFGELASQYSIEPMSQSNNGRVPPLARHNGQETLEREAFKLKPGGVEAMSGIISTGADRWVILRCVGFTEPVVTDFEAVREELTRDLYEKKQRLAMANKMDELKEAAQVDNFLEVQAQMGKIRQTSATAPISR